MQKIKVLHLSNTTDTESLRISRLFNKHSAIIASRHIAWDIANSKENFDLIGVSMTRAEIADRLAWADVIHYHNDYEGQAVFDLLETTPPSKPGVIHLHTHKVGYKSPGLLVAIPGRFRKNDYPNAAFVLPEVVDTTEWFPSPEKRQRTTPAVTACVSSLTDEKNRRLVYSVSESLKDAGKILYYPPITVAVSVDTQQGHKKSLDIAIDNVVDVGYSVESLEFMASGCPCLTYLDKPTENQIRMMVGSDNVPWIKVTRDTFHPLMLHIINTQKWLKLGEKCRGWMVKNWSPTILLAHYEEMYKDLLGKE